MKKSIVCATICIGLAWATPSVAATQWEVVGLFDDGGVALGTFLYDGSGPSSIDITTSAGSVLGGETYKYADPDFFVDDQAPVLNQPSNNISTSTGALVMILQSNLPDSAPSGTSIQGVLGGNSREGLCEILDGDCVQVDETRAYRSFSGLTFLSQGETDAPEISPIPLPSSLVLLSGALIGLMGLRSRRT